MGPSRRRRRQFGKQQQPGDEVVLRRWRRDGDIIALFPDMPVTLEGLVMSYQHVGQHGAADYAHVLGQTVPVPVEEPDRDRDELLEELRAIGYRPVARQRRSRGKH